MPKCKNCGSRLTRFDKDICPICGEKKPLEGVSSETVEITSNLDLNLEEMKTFKPSTRFTTFILLAFLGWTGAAHFYLKYRLQAVLWIFFNLMIMGGLFALLYFLFVPHNLLLAIFLPLGIIYLINFITAIYAFLKHNLKDGNGEFLR